ncbi:MAG: sugar ABC transporter ATP-binding protein, partial [Deltaproteobacteria bacterium]|nr:sugar ABC transporter ATP-binding protein [Deltaproteobacteria bacterium]
MASPEPPPLVSLTKVSKTFGQTCALDEVSLALYPGEIHVLAGENGAGKSTLIRILSGIYQDYEGELALAGATLRFASPTAAVRAGVATIHQELSLVGPMSVADNLALGTPGNAWTLVRRDQERGRARRVLAAVGLDIDPTLPVETFPLAVRQLVEVARALAQEAQVLVMDEPTSALSEAEAERLFARVEDLRDRGHAVLYISHRMEEIERLADRISVLRDGRLVTTSRADELSRDELIRAMVGRDLNEASTVTPPPFAEAALLEIADLCVDAPQGQGHRLLSEVSLSVGCGEIVGLAGLQGSGAGALLYALVGALPRAGGTVVLEGQPLDRPTPKTCIDAGMVLLSGDRGLSLVRELSVIDNAGLSSLTRFSPGGWLRSGRLRRAVAKTTDQLRLDCPSLEAPAWQLSGGNQQKVALARALLTQPRVLLLDEPTRGIDIGAKQDVYERIGRLAQQG